MATNKFDIFISYQWDIKEKVLKLYELISASITKKIWLDKYQIKSGTVLFEELKEGIDNSSVIISCITVAYSQSKNCQDELGYALFAQKPILVLMFEQLNLAKDIGWMGFKIVNFTRCNVYKDTDLFEKKCGPVYDELMTSIHSILGSSKIVKTKESVDRGVNSNNQGNTNKANVKIADHYDLSKGDRSFLESKTCEICREFEQCTKLWSKFYCFDCWSLLSCRNCGQVVNKAKVFKDETEDKYVGRPKDNVLCENCFYRDSSNNNAKQDLSLDIEKFSDRSPGYSSRKISCFVCKNDVTYKEYYTYFFILGTRELWGKYYCKACWAILGCKNCSSKIDKNKAFRGNNNAVFCRNCITKFPLVNKNNGDKKSSTCSLL